MKLTHQIILKSALLAISALSPCVAESVGRAYATRDPKTCSSTKEPSKGAPSAAQATTYFTCTMEYVFGSKLVLVENVKIEVGNGRRFLRSDSELKDVDPQYPIYPIRGSFDRYYCSPLKELLQKNTPNCFLSHPRNTSGVCYRTSFGEWRCEMSDNTSYRDSETVMGPH